MTRRRSAFPWRAACRLLAVSVLVGGICGSSAAQEAAAPRPLVVAAQLENEAITPITARYLQRAIDQGERQHAQCVVILLDTPGGLVESTSAIIKDILNSKACVVVYVTPQGGRAASAGGFLLLSSDIAAMAPVTRVGAMHPVQIGGLPTGPPQTPAEPQESSDEESPERRPAGGASEQKTVNDTVAWARGLADLRRRNVDWAEQAVRESIVATETEALEQGVIDLIADDLDDLLQQLDGREVQLRDRTLTLQTAEAEIQNVEMWWGDQILATLSSPNIAFLLLIFGFYGILFEMYSPGWGVAGTLGAICLILAFMGLAVLPINYVGLALIVLGLALLVAEAMVPSFGMLTAGGVLCLVMGGLMLVESPEGFLRVSMSVVIPVAAATAVITLLLMTGIVRAYRGHVQTGSEGMTSTAAVAAGEFGPEGDHFVGSVHVHGERWRAISPQPVAARQTVTIRDREGLTLHVEPPGPMKQET